MDIRPALPDDADEMSRILTEIFDAKQRETKGDPVFVLQRYITHPARLLCSVALDDDSRILGFQSLKRAWTGNPYGVPVGWGIIGTHISPNSARRGVGSALFQRSLQAAKSASLKAIDATIGETNGPGLAYYEALGFKTYRKVGNGIGKAFQVDERP